MIFLWIKSMDQIYFSPYLLFFSHFHNLINFQMKTSLNSSTGLTLDLMNKVEYTIPAF